MAARKKGRSGFKNAQSQLDKLEPGYKSSKKKAAVKKKTARKRK